MKKIIKRMSGFRKNRKAVFVLLVGMVILIITTTWYLNTDFHQVRAVSQVLREVGYIKSAEVQYDENQDKYIIKTSVFKLMPTDQKLELCEEISSRLKKKTNFKIISGDKEYYCDYADKDGLILYSDDSQIYSEKEHSERMSAASSSSGSSSSTQPNSSRVADGYDWVSMTPS